MKRPYFSKYTCSFCKNVATRYTCGSNTYKKYIICNREECKIQADIKLKYSINNIKGIKI